MRIREKTDATLPNSWLLTPIASYVIWAFVAALVGTSGILGIGSLAYALTILGLAGFFLSTGTAYLVFRLVNRRNNHFAREQALLWQSLERVRSSVKPIDMNAQMALNWADRNFGRLAETSGERSAVLWALLTLIPYAGWLVLIVVLSFLSDDMNGHKIREENVVQDLNGYFRTVGSPGLPLPLHRSRHLFVLYAVLSIVTLGVFSLFWLYESMTAPLGHFQYHLALEDSLAKSLLPPTGGPVLV